MADFDAFIVGTGPAGCAAALSLADFAPELRVCLIGTAVQDAGIGETVPPPVRPMLEHLGVWEEFLADRHCASYRTLSAWGSPSLNANEFLFHAWHVGWRLDRGRFDAMLRCAARGRVAASAAGRLVDFAAAGGGWRFACEDGSSGTARFAIDATGRAAVLGRSQRLRPLAFDRLVGCAAHFTHSPDHGEGLVIEAFADGWWYTAAIPGGRRVVACMTDADEARRLRVSRPEVFLRMLGETRHVRDLAAGTRLDGAPRTWPANSRRLQRNEALPLVCVGDAASCYDPISGQGIAKALRSGIFAAYAVADALRHGDGRGLARHHALTEQEFDAYRATLRDYYALESRWPDRPFWRRRIREAAHPAGELSVYAPAPSC